MASASYIIDGHKVVRDIRDLIVRRCGPWQDRIYIHTLCVTHPQHVRVVQMLANRLHCDNIHCPTPINISIGVRWVKNRPSVVRDAKERGN